MRGAIHLVEPYQPTEQDKLREQKMTNIMSLATLATEPEVKRKWLKRYTELHEQRSPEYVAWMEAKLGLARG